MNFVNGLAAAHNFVGFVDFSLVNCKIKDLLARESFFMLYTLLASVFCRGFWF